MSSPADVGLLSPVWAGTRAEELTSDDAVVRAMLRASAALLTALASSGVAPAAVGAAAPAVEALEVDARELALAAVAGGNPVIPLVPLVRAAVPSDVAEWVHFGATSQDVLDSALMLVASDVMVSGRGGPRDGGAGARRPRAVRARDVPLVGRTLDPAGAADDARDARRRLARRRARRAARGPRLHAPPGLARRSRRHGGGVRRPGGRRVRRLRECARDGPGDRSCRGTRGARRCCRCPTPSRPAAPPSARSPRTSW